MLRSDFLLIFSGERPHRRTVLQLEGIIFLLVNGAVEGPELLEYIFLILPEDAAVVHENKRAVFVLRHKESTSGGTGHASMQRESRRYPRTHQSTRFF